MVLGGLAPRSPNTPRTSSRPTVRPTVAARLPRSAPPSTFEVFDAALGLAGAAGASISAAYKGAAALVIFMAVIFFKPQGLLGKKVERKV